MSAARARRRPSMRRWSAAFLRSHAPIEPGPAEMLSAVNFSLGERRIEAPVCFHDLRRLGRPNAHVASGKFRLAATDLLPRRQDRSRSKPPALPLGLFDDAEYDEFTFNAKPGDMFVFFSDGILDARNRAGELFGRRAWKRSSQQCHNESVDCVVKRNFCRGR